MEQKEINKQKQDLKEKGWIYLGELEYSDIRYTPTHSNLFPWYLYVRYSNNAYYYSISDSLFGVGKMIYYKFDNPISILAFLQVLMSVKDIGWLNDKNAKIRLIGMENWIGHNEKFYEGKITLKKMEEDYFESKKIKNLRKESKIKNLRLKY